MTHTTDKAIGEVHCADCDTRFNICEHDACPKCGSTQVILNKWLLAAQKRQAAK